MRDLDDILNRHAEEKTMKPSELKKALVDTTCNSREFYRCESDNYTVVFEPLSGKAHYQFDNQDNDGIEQVLTRDQINYYLNSSYWQPSLPSSEGS